MINHYFLMQNDFITLTLNILFLKKKKQFISVPHSFVPNIIYIVLTRFLPKESRAIKRLLGAVLHGLEVRLHRAQI